MVMEIWPILHNKKGLFFFEAVSSPLPTRQITNIFFLEGAQKNLTINMFGCKNKAKLFQYLRNWK